MDGKPLQFDSFDQKVFNMTFQIQYFNIHSFKIFVDKLNKGPFPPSIISCVRLLKNKNHIFPYA